MKSIIILSLISLTCAAQDTTKYVITCSPAKVRNALEAFTQSQVTAGKSADVIQFNPDGNGVPITSIENFKNARYQGVSADLKAYLISQGYSIPDTVSIKGTLRKYCNKIVYVKPVIIEP